MPSSETRAVILVGAGASIPYGAPSTNQLTTDIEHVVVADRYMQHTGGDAAFQHIKQTLGAYLSSPNVVNFEHIYHCAHELIFANAPTAGAADEYRPLMHPFLNNVSGVSEVAARALSQKMVAEIFRIISAASITPTQSLNTLSTFLRSIKNNYITRIYTTNYDDFILQADDDLYVGFSRKQTIPQPFDLDTFYTQDDIHSLYHLHGSIHCGYPRQGDIGELFWFDSASDALRNATFSGSDENRMDGTGVLRSATVTGLDKLSRLQVRPLSHFYAAFARDTMLADVIFVIGAGLGDLHLNNWLHEARHRQHQPRLIFVDLWRGGFQHWHFPDISNYKEIQMLHKLRIYLDLNHPGATSPAPNWVLSADSSSAVYSNGLIDFLASPADLNSVMASMGLKT